MARDGQLIGDLVAHFIIHGRYCCGHGGIFLSLVANNFARLVYMGYG